MRLLVISAILFTMLATALWALMILAVPVTPGVVPDVRFGASTTAIIAAVCWVGFAANDRDKDALVTAMAEFSLRHAQKRTRPDLRRVS
jgi:hypothetical protein